MTKILWRVVTAAIKPVTIMLLLNNVLRYGAWLFKAETADGFENYPCT